MTVSVYATSRYRLIADIIGALTSLHLAWCHEMFLICSQLSPDLRVAFFRIKTKQSSHYVRILFTAEYMCVKFDFLSKERINNWRFWKTGCWWEYLGLKDEETEGRRKLHKEKLLYVHSSPNITRVMKERGIQWNILRRWIHTKFQNENLKRREQFGENIQMVIIGTCVD
jgi:hypothetical protein